MNDMRHRQWIRFCTVIGLAVLLSSASLVVRAEVTRVTLVGPGTYGEDDDYFTRVWGNPRDMDDSDDLYLLSSSCGPLRSRWTDVSFSNGIWSAVTRSEGGTRSVTVLNPGWVSSLDMGGDGQLRPIDTRRYTQLTLRMRIASGAGTSRPDIHWANGPIGATPPRGTKRFQVQGDGLWHIYTLNLGLDSRWTSGPVSWLWFKFDSLRAGYRVEIDWVRLSPRQSRRVQWQGDSLSGSARVYLGPDSAHPDQYGDLLIYEGSETPLYISASARSLSVPASLPPGRYYARVEAGGRGANSSASWRFLPLPIAKITAPSYTSGEDWATAVLGDPWDMAGLADVSVDSTEMDGVQSMRVAGGVLTVVSRDDGMGNCSEPWPHRPLGLNLGGQRIDPSKYRYFSYRYKVDNAPDQGAGGVSRVRWQARHLRYWPTGRTDDISLYDNGWHTYSLDLKTVRQEGEMGEWEDIPADVMQIMLHESHRQWTSHLDWVKLTAENVARGSYTVRWTVANASQPFATTLYWATRQGETFQIVPGSGRMVTSRAEPSEVEVRQGHVLYLPLMIDGSEGFQYEMSVAGLQAGQTYHVAVKLDDGHNVSWWYSKVPVRVL